MGFDCEGLAYARKALTELTAIPTRSANSARQRQLIDELYVEIRAARKAGNSWINIRKHIVENVKGISLSEGFLKRYFEEVDKKWQKETGEPALSVKLRARK